MKETHTIVEKWPYKLKIPLGQAGGQEEFDNLVTAAYKGDERYIEWKWAAKARETSQKR